MRFCRCTIQIHVYLPYFTIHATGTLLWRRQEVPIQQIQSAQNSLNHVVLSSLCYPSASERLDYLHWLPVHYRIQFELLHSHCQPSYLNNLLQLHQPSRALCSLTQQLLQVPYMSTDFGRHAFSYSSPATRNSISSSVKNCSSLYLSLIHIWRCRRRG